MRDPISRLLFWLRGWLLRLRISEWFFIPDILNLLFKTVAADHRKLKFRSFQNKIPISRAPNFDLFSRDLFPANSTGTGKKRGGGASIESDRLRVSDATKIALRPRSKALVAGWARSRAIKPINNRHCTPLGITWSRPSLSLFYNRPELVIEQFSFAYAASIILPSFFRPVYATSGRHLSKYC